MGRARVPKILRTVSTGQNGPARGADPAVIHPSGRFNHRFGRSASGFPGAVQRRVATGGAGFAGPCDGTCARSAVTLAQTGVGATRSPARTGVRGERDDVTGRTLPTAFGWPFRTVQALPEGPDAAMPDWDDNDALAARNAQLRDTLDSVMREVEQRAEALKDAQAAVAALPGRVGSVREQVSGAMAPLAEPPAVRPPRGQPPQRLTRPAPRRPAPSDEDFGGNSIMNRGDGW